MVLNTDFASAFFKGLGGSASIAAGYVPIAVSFGLAASHAGLSPELTVLVSAFIYAGASQFILVALLAAGGSAPSVVGIVLLMNLRHLFYGPALLNRFPSGSRCAPMPLLAAGLTDEVFATSVSKLDRLPVHQRENWYLGLQLGAYMSWVGGTALGAYFGHDWLAGSPVLSQSLGFVLPALFLALLLEIRRLVPVPVLVWATLAAVLGLFLLPTYGAIVLGMLAGAYVASRR